ncbi:hypothetical protein CPC16_010280 [Podila verticillata]|nr:hypothetical protein CPC16_010280 [Podila verticillata]KAI9232496.1 MAG: hypothetical protein BYD32DRAFT_475349 [Podila humilis]
MSDKLARSGSFDTFFASLQFFYTTKERLAHEIVEDHASEAVEATAALEEPGDVLLDRPPDEASKFEGANTAHFSPATTPPWGQCDTEHSTAELSTGKDITGRSREHFETGAKDEDNLVSVTQQSPVLTSPLRQSKWVQQPSTSGPPKLVNMSPSPSSRQGCSSPPDEPRTSSCASVTTASLPLEESKWAINKLAGQRGAVKPSDQGHLISSPSRVRASSGLGFAGKDSGGHIQDKRRQRYSRDDLMVYSKYRKPPPNIFWIVTTICGAHTTARSDGNAAAQVLASKATNYHSTSVINQRDSNRNRSHSALNDGKPFKTESTPLNPVRLSTSPPKPSPNVQESIPSGSGGLGGKVFSLPKSRDPKGPPSPGVRGFQH